VTLLIGHRTAPGDVPHVDVKGFDVPADSGGQIDAAFDALLELRDFEAEKILRPICNHDPVLTRSLIDFLRAHPWGVKIAPTLCKSCGSEVDAAHYDPNYEPTEMELQDADSGNICVTCGKSLPFEAT
jgi:hypothetical protein